MYKGTTELSLALIAFNAFKNSSGVLGAVVTPAFSNTFLLYNIPEKLTAVGIPYTLPSTVLSSRPMYSLLSSEKSPSGSKKSGASLSGMLVGKSKTSP
ncbi:hypothetical protein D3C80_1464410 [compost metagenome]